ncbi:MAG: hypothetical protein ABIR26_06365 [Ramlibacter sp.]
MQQSNLARAQETDRFTFPETVTDMERLSRFVDATKNAGEIAGAPADWAVTEEEIDALYDEAMHSYIAGEWADAGLIAIQLAMLAPSSGRFLLMAETCLERLKLADTPAANQQEVETPG